MERSIFKNGKPSISIRAIEKPWLSPEIISCRGELQPLPSRRCGAASGDVLPGEVLPQLGARQDSLQGRSVFDGFWWGWRVGWDGYASYYSWKFLRLEDLEVAKIESDWLRYPDPDLPLSTRGATSIYPILSHLIPLISSECNLIELSIIRIQDILGSCFCICWISYLYLRILFLNQNQVTTLTGPCSTNASLPRIQIWSMTCTFAPSASTSASRLSASLSLIDARASISATSRIATFVVWEGKHHSGWNSCNL